MKKTLAIILALVMLLSLMAGCGKTEPAAPADPASPAAPADDGKTYTLRIGTGTGGKDCQVMYMQELEKALEEATGGRIDVQGYPAGQLGTMPELVQGVIDGSVDSVAIPTSYFSTVFAEASLSDLATLYPNGGDQLWNILMEEDTKYEEAFAAHGVVPASWLIIPNRVLLTTDKVDSIDDLKNTVIWTLPSAVYLKELELLGVTTSTINVGEVAPSLANGTIGGAYSNIALFSSQSLQNGGGNYLLEYPNGAMISVFGISQVWWSKLPADLQEIVLQVANDVAKNYEYGYVQDQITGGYAAMQEGGMEVVTPDDALKAEFDKALSTMESWYLENYPEAKEVYEDMVARVEADTRTYD